jgi:hypothetical protein
LIDDKPIGATLNRNLGSPTAPGEAVESELDRLITRRHDQRVKDEGERQLEEAWRERESVARRPAGERRTGAAGCRGIGAWSAATWSGRRSVGGGQTP